MAKKSKSLFIIFGSQLFDPKFLQNHSDHQFYMAECFELCTYYKFHKQKIAFFLSSMRHYAQELRELQFSLHYTHLEETMPSQKYVDLLRDFLINASPETLTCFEIEDKFMEQEIKKLSQEFKIPLTFLRSPQFVVTRQKFKDYLVTTKKPFMKTFYEQQRKDFGILMTDAKVPVGGKFSFDEDNRLRWPEKESAPSIPTTEFDNIDHEVFKLVEKHFANHPGQLESSWIPTTRKQAQLWLKDFCKSRLEQFGPYEDAITPKEDFLFHSALSPLMNIGFLTAADVIKYALKTAETQSIPLNSLEGFIRQVIGWREFVRGIYQNYSEVEEKENFFHHHNKLNANWYSGTTGCAPLDDAIKKAQRLAYNHHIERLMVICNIMNLTQIHPQEVHRWFMEMYADSSDWVMGPNVYGMGLFSDGGIFATKPYICGSNYLLKMSSYKKADWCEEIDGLYWRFIDNHQDYFRKNYRLNMMVKSLEKMPAEKKGRLFKAANEFTRRNTQ
ncbi:MAG: cryptochrome/photolyase family protein [Bdellovibrionia bacterium]